MSNIKVSLIAKIGSPSLIEEYGEYINAADESSRGKLQQKLEKALGEQVFGAKKVAGNPRLVQDWYIDDKKAAQEIVNNLGMFQIDDDGVLRIEGKLQRKSESSTASTTIGGTVLFSRKATETPDYSILEEIRKLSGSKRQSIDSRDAAIRYEDFLLRTLKNKSPEDRFYYIQKNAPTTIHAPAYNKSKNLSIFSLTGGSLQAYNIFFPLSKFKPPLFAVSFDKESRKLGYYLNTAFEKELVRRLNNAVTTGVNNQTEKELLAQQKSLTSKLKVKRTTTKNISFSDKKEKIDIIYYTTNSIPVSNGIIRGGKKLKIAGDEPSLVDISIAVRGRTRLRMRRGDGEPYPPKIFERSGDFRSSIKAVADLRANTIDYFYTPYYDRLERYGYEINDLVEGSIRAIAQSQFNRRFNLTRTFT